MRSLLKVKKAPHFHTVTLEISLKPFCRTDEAFVHEVCAGVLEQWRPLLKGRETISILIFAADGSEILDYSGDLDAPFEWCKYIGTANHPSQGPDDPPWRSLHERRVLYCENPPVMTYRDLQRVVAAFKDEGVKAFPGARVNVGAMFDLGPEFAESDFKYRRHIELCTGSKLDSFGMLDATASMHADTRRYAAYPDGVPEGLPFGTFLGAQSARYLPDLGFDYLWLGNGLGFSSNPWDTTGKIFDGETFHPERLSETKAQVFRFWKLFREACPDIPIEVRGTNNTVGIDYSSDGVPLYDIYRAGFGITPPPNSPWAAITGNYGLELAGHLSRNCELPGEDMMFRYYIHDPWWVNSPWYDRYGGRPTDIYLPMALSRISREGKVGGATMLNLLTIDNSFGGMPDSCVNEPIPHLLKAEKDAPDAPAPLIWVYPLRGYTTTEDPALLAEMHSGDTFICAAINDGFPLSGVVSADSFLAHSPDLYRASVLVSPAPESAAVLAKLLAFAESGGHVLFYGSTARLAGIPKHVRFHAVDTAGPAAKAREALEACGTVIRFEARAEWPEARCIVPSRSDNALLLAVFNPHETTDTLLRFPFGAPIPIGHEAVFGADGLARLRFARAEHCECRVFVEQTSGIVGVREEAPVNAHFRRRLTVTGLENATVRLFPEADAVDSAAVTANISSDWTPVLDVGWRLVRDPVGTYLEKEGVTGDLALLMT